MSDSDCAEYDVEKVKVFKNTKMFVTFHYLSGSRFGSQNSTVSRIVSINWFSVLVADKSLQVGWTSCPGRAENGESCCENKYVQNWTSGLAESLQWASLWKISKYFVSLGAGFNYAFANIPSWEGV